MQLTKDLRERLAKECRRAADRMEQSKEFPRKLYYFSVFFGESQRILNWQWDRDLNLMRLVTEQVYGQLQSTLQTPGFAQQLPVQFPAVFDQLTQCAAALATYLEHAEADQTDTVFCALLGSLSELGYAVTGNGSYLCEKGLIKLQST